MKVKCISWVGGMFTVGNIYSVKNGNIIDNYEKAEVELDAFVENGLFEIVEEKDYKDPSWWNMVDEVNRSLCSEKKFTATKVPYMNEIVEALNDGMQSHAHTFIKANSITVPWTLAKSHNKIDRINRCLCSEKKYISVSTPTSKEQSTVSKFVENDFHQKQHNKASIFIGDQEVF